MIKKLIALLIVSALALSLAACGEAGSDSSVKKAVGYEPLDYIKLGEYTGIAVDLTTSDNQALVESKLSKYPGVQLTDRAVEKGDTVNIAYAGRLKSSGEAFQGGTSESYDLTIGSGKFISGFEDGLIGVMPGQTVDLDLTFPDPYPKNTELSGAPVVFTVTVHYIKGNSEDEIRIAQNSVAASLLLSQIAQSAAYTGKLPEKPVNEKVDRIIANISNTASYYGMDLESFLAAAYSTTEAEMREQARSTAEQQVKQEIALYAVAETDGIELSDEQYSSMLSIYATVYGFKSAEDFVAANTANNLKSFLFNELIYSHLTQINDVKR